MSYHGIAQAELSRHSIETLTGPIPDCLDPTAFRDARLCAGNPNGPGCEWSASDPGQQSWMLGLPECGGSEPYAGLGVSPALALIAIAGTDAEEKKGPSAGKVLVALALVAVVVWGAVKWGPGAARAR